MMGNNIDAKMMIELVKFIGTAIIHKVVESRPEPHQDMEEAPSHQVMEPAPIAIIS